MCQETVAFNFLFVIYNVALLFTGRNAGIADAHVSVLVAEQVSRRNAF